MPSLVQGRFIREILQGTNIGSTMEEDTDIDIREVYFLIMHFLSSGPCHRTFGQLWNELLEHKLLPRRYHAWYSRKGLLSGDEDDDGLSYPLNYTQLVNRYPHIGKNHLVKLLKQLLLKTSASANSYGLTGANVPTLLGSGLFSLLESEQTSNSQQLNQKVNYLCWPHSQGNQVHALSLREIGGGFTKHHRAPSIRAASYAIAKPSSLLQKIERIKTLRGHLSAVYCAIFDRSGQYFISGSDDRLVKIWSMETGFCLSSCRGHTGDITDLAVSINNVLVASASNDCIIRVWRLPDGFPISVLRGHTLAVTAIAFSPRPGCEHHLLSSSDDGSCRIWDSRDHHVNPRIYIPKPDDGARLTVSRSNDHPQSSNHQGYKILCCAFNASGTSFVTGSSDNLARVWSVMKRPDEVANQHHHELDVLTGHENDVNYVQFSCTAVPGRLFSTATIKEESVPNLKNGWLTHDNIVTCSRDGSAIIWIPRSRKSHGRTIRWTRAYHLKVPPPPVPPQQPRGGPRQRTVPTPRGVNMIVWSLDNHFVLAAITDNRICVWNAVDGSLVHCLTGHTESTYVLDVHPFDPRIAMSAGYDGKTIVWDIWQGVPIRIYEVGKFKLVDGKFSPDGTSIVLSDDFGQIYILGTGDGRSQKDAKYDQFFLGDYLNLTHDINGNVVDQETMLTPYARNQQDLLCDVGRIPYPEPYQSMYQQRRSLALGIDWKPSSINLGVGAGDTSFYAMPDDNSNRGRFLDYPVELPDGLDLELENENPSDDTGSEYYATDESSSEGLPPSLNEESLGESENSAEELYSSNDDGYYVSNIPRSRKMRRKETIHVSSGRRLKRKASDENGSGFTIKKSKYSRHGKSTLDNKKSSGKVSRPQRRAARNARQLFSAIEEAFEGESDSEGSGSSADEENILSEECETPESSGVQLGSSDNEEIYEQHSLHLQPSSSSRKYHVMRNEESHSPTPTFPIQHEESKEVKVTEPTKRTGIVWKFRCNETRPVNLIQQATSDRALDRQEGSIFGVSLKGKQQVGSHNYDKIHITQPGNALEPKDMKDRSEVPCQSGIEETNESSKETENVLSSHQDGLLGRPGKAIEWGEAKARRSKRPRMNESIVIANSLKPNTDKLYFLSKQMLPSRVGRGSYDQSSELFNKNCSQEHINQTQKSYVAACGTFLSQLNDKDNPTDSEAMLPKTQSQKVASPSQFNIDVCQVEDDHRQDAVHVSNGNANGFHNLLENGHSLAVTGVNQNRFGKFMRRSKRGNQDRNAIIHMENQYLQTNNINLKHEMGWANNWPRNAVHMGNSCEASGSRGLHDEPNSKFIGEDNEREGYEDGQQFESSVNHAKECSADLGGSSSGGPNRITRIKFTCNKVPMIGPQRMRSKRAIHARKSDIEAGDCFKNQSILERRKGKEEVERHNKVQLRNKEPIYGLEWGSTSTRLCGIRDHSTKKDSAITNSRMLSERKIGKQIAKKQSWLMLYEAEEGLRYIPQLGDTVAYIKQGHEEFLQASPFQERAPWKIIKGNIRCVELCCVEGLDYATVPGSGETCCKLTLRFTDPESDVFGKTFRLNLPEVTHTADFLVERSRYDSSLNRNWTIRDKCRVWWTNDKGEEGSWYDGRIIAVKPKSDEFPDSPWDRYHVQYKADTDGPQKHSPWELFDLDDYSFEQPQIDHNTRETLLQVLEDIEKPSNSKADRYGLGKFSQALEKPEFLNRIPLPMALDIIMRRLENSYYRQLDAFKHDIGTMVANAKAYFTKDTKTIAKLQRFEKKVFAKLES